MPEGDCSAVHVELVVVDPQFAGAGQRPRGERLVDLHQVDVVDREPRALQRLAYMGTGPMPM